MIAPIGASVALVLLLSAALAASPADAGGSGKPGHSAGFKKPAAQGHHGHHHVGHKPFAPTRPWHWPFAPRPFAPYRYPGGVYAAPPVFYGSLYAPPSYPEPPAVYSPPIVYVPQPGYTLPVSTSLSLAPPPPPSVIEYPEGRYELRGDGITTPHTWEWIPNVPPRPPGPPPTALPEPPAPEDHPPPAARRSLYRWIGDQGVVSFTDSLDAIPEAYRARAKRVTP